MDDELDERLAEYVAISQASRLEWLAVIILIAAGVTLTAIFAALAYIGFTAYCWVCGDAAKQLQRTEQ